VGCYLCEHRGVDRPREDLGTCSRCSVRACSAHSTRYGRLQCAICAPLDMTHPALLDPVIWALATAYQLG
jgi:hypothetical protein